MQKPIEGVYQKTIEGEVRIGAFHNQKNVEKPEPPKPTRNQSPQKPLYHTTQHLYQRNSLLTENSNIEYAIQKRDATPHQQ